MILSQKNMYAASSSEQSGLNAGTVIPKNSGGAAITVGVHQIDEAVQSEPFEAPGESAKVNLDGKVDPLKASSSSELKNESQAKGMPNLGEYSFSWGKYLSSIGLLFLILAGLFVCLHLLKKKGALRFVNPGGIRVDARLSIGRKKQLMVVSHSGKRLLIGVTDHHISLLDTYNDVEEESEEAPARKKKRFFRAKDQGEQEIIAQSNSAHRKNSKSNNDVAGKHLEFDLLLENFQKKQ